MKLFAPDYYKEFKCIADRCTHSCCIGWEIDVDREALKRYRSSAHPYADKVLSSISSDGEPHFSLCEGERCPHLDERGLCRIITEMGEGYLCDICREHPRFYNTTPLGREVGLGMSCEEACRIILSSDSYAVNEIGRARGGVRKCAFIAPVTRETLYSILSDRTSPYEKRLNDIALRYGIPPTEKSDAEWREILGSLEYLDDAHRELFLCYSSNPKTAKSLDGALERALAYFIYRHCAEAENEAEHRNTVGLCLMLERLLASVAAAKGVTTAEGLIPYAQALSEELEYSEDNTDTLKTELLF